MQREAQLSRIFWLYTLIIIAVSAVAWTIVTVSAHHGAIYPRNTFLYVPVSQFSDWTNFAVRVAHHGEPDVLTRRDINSSPYPYPLTSFYIYLAFVRSFHDSLRAYLIASVMVFTVTGLLFLTFVRKYFRAASLAVAVIVTLLLAEPMYFLLDRANIEIFLWLFVVIGLLAFVKDKPWIALSLFGLAAAMKIYPFLYLLLFVKRRQWRYLVAGTFLTVALSLGSMYEVGPTVRSAMQETSKSGDYLKKNQIVVFNENGTRFDHSLLGMEKSLTFAIKLARHQTSYANPPYYLRPALVYSVLAPLLFVAVYFGFVIRLPLMNQFQAFTLLSLLLPYVSYEYTLIHACTMLAVFVYYLITDYHSGRSALSFKTARYMMVGFAVLMVPLSFGALTIAPALPKGLILIAMLVLFMAVPMRSTLFSDLTEQNASGDVAQIA
jgi:hypothetical protein